MEIIRTFDVDYVNSVITNPVIYDLGRDDGTIPAEDIDVAPAMESDGCYFLIPVHEGQNIGVILYHKLTGICYEAHINILPEFAGAGLSHEAGELSFSWMFENTECRKVIAHIPKNKKSAKVLRLASNIGMSIEGLITDYIKIDDVVYDGFIMGITKE